ncbi:glycosyltransferase family 32 protein [Russula earlei]|uniref:Glycosyltransferase family 32 protein n=1 Tax=Russula earlei TaxID=71964 RepID=A0ACC0U8Z7_9AGAM|nr:glycosyltransferase family 32 protein [Russula earlei]
MTGASYLPLPVYSREPTPDDSHPYPPPNGAYFYPHRRRARWLRPRSCVKYTAPAMLLLLFLSYLTWEPHIEIAFYWRSWVRQEIEPVTPLRGCFEPDQVSPLYNVSERLYGPRLTEVHAGMPMRLGLDCYDFAGTIRAVAPSALAPDRRPRVNFHTYWRTDLAPFSERQVFTLKSFFATQNRHSRLIMWSNGDLSTNALLASYVARYPGAFELRVADVRELSKGTPLENSPLLTRNDEKAWLDGDLIRLLVIWKDGGVWVDMDTLLTRDLTPLLEHEFVTQWDCYDKIYQPLNGALMHFRQHSPYLCEAFHLMTTSSPPRPSSTDWGSVLYHRLWRRLVAGGVPPFKILPFCFSDGLVCRLDNRLPDPFDPDPSDGHWTGGLTRADGGGLDRKLGKVFAVHLHNRWEKNFPPGGWVDRLLLRRYEKKLAEGVGW